MRDPNRIYRIQNLVTSLWGMYPDLRFTQLQRLIDTKIKQIKQLPHAIDSTFNVEDDVTEVAIQALVNGERI